MNSIFEELMTSNRQLTEGVKRTKKTEKKKVNVTESAKKISCKKIKLESRRVFENTSYEDLDDQFAVDPDDSAEDEVVLVIDPEAPADEEIPEEAAEEMVGDSVYKCPICGANYVCDCDAAGNESIEVDENGVPTECPICGDDTEQILVGEIAPAEEAGEETELPPMEAEDEEEEEIIEDSVKPARKVESRRRKNEDLCPDCGEEECVCENELTLVDPVEEEEEEKAPAVEIDADVVNLNLDDSRFESMMTQMIRENYKFNPSFKITRVSSKGSQLKVEYVVREAKGKRTKGVLLGEGFSRQSCRMKLRFKDKGAFTESFTKTPSFVMECVRVRNKVIPTKMSYNFTKRVNESLYRVYGSVDSSKKNVN